MAGNQNNYGQYSTAQPYIQYLQNEINRLQTQLNTMMNQNNQPQQEQHSSDLSLPVRHADITQVKDKSIVKKEKVDPGCSRMFMTESEEEIYIKTVDDDGNITLYTYLQQDPENITNETEFVTKADLKSMLDEAVQSFSTLVPQTDSFVRKDEIRDIIVETLSSSRGRKKEED